MTGVGPRRLALEAGGIFLGALGILMMLAPDAPFTKELGVCESGAVRDVLAGNFLLPRFIPGPIVHVPPLYWWSAAAAVRLVGWNELALRIPALVPAALTGAIIYGWVLTRFNREAAFWAAAALLLDHFFLDAARQPRMDSMLALFVTAAMIALERAIATRRRGWFGAAAIAIGLGCLTKGILGIALPGAVVAVYLIVRRRWAELFRVDLIMAFAAGLAIGLSWYVAGYEIAGRKFLQWQIGMNLWSRVIPAAAGGANYCVHPIWYFAPQILIGFLPWSLFIPALAAAMWSEREPSIPEPIVYALCWFGGIFMLFSLPRGKCPVYILPAFPPLAVLIGWTFAGACAEVPPRPWLARLFSAGAATIALGALILVGAAVVVLRRGLPVISFKLHPTDARFLDIFCALAASHDYGLLNWTVVSAVGALVIARGAWRRLPGLGALGVLLIAFAGARFWFGVMTPALADRETLAPFAREIMDVVPAGATIGHIGIEDCDLYFYSPRPIEPVFHFRCDAAGAFPPYLVIRKNRFDALTSAERACLTPVLVSEPVDSNGARILVEQKP
jgi:hypothetical protein